MKNIIRITVLTLILMGCKKDFITILPTSNVTIDVLYITDKDYQDAITGAYRTLQQLSVNFWQFGDLRGDDTQAGITSNTPTYAFDIDQFYINNDATLLSDTWRDYYKLINRVNTVLSKIENTDPSIVTNKARHTAEAKFLRAFAYFNMVRIFGDVPMITSPVTVQESYNIARAPVDNIYNQIIIPDLIAAATGLSLKYTGNDVGRATIGAAKALLGNVYLTVHDYINAEAKLQEVTTMGYALLPNFNDLFDYTKNEHHSEYIFDIEFEQGISLGNPLTNQFAVSTQGGGAGVPAEEARLYGITGGGGGDSGCPIQDLFDSFDPLDKRKDITVAKGFTGANGVFIPLSTKGVPSFCKKYMCATIINSDSKANWKVLRYADVLLMYAEALNENGKTAQALTYLNLVRVRAGLAGYTGLTQSDTRDKILTERRFELYLEGHRWFDLLRTGRALSACSKYGMKNYMTVFPIPLSQILLVNNTSIFAQNPGYE
jgi:starch-binding outer membrane protein, SusD/RagB family